MTWRQGGEEGVGEPGSSWEGEEVLEMVACRVRGEEGVGEPGASWEGEEVLEMAACRVREEEGAGGPGARAGCRRWAEGAAGG